MALAEQLDKLSELLVNAYFAINCATYHSMNSEQQKQVKDEFIAVKRLKYHSFDNQFQKDVISVIKGILIVKMNL
jgi:lipid-binding SYLF domain-containing protein